MQISTDTDGIHLFKDWSHSAHLKKARSERHKLRLRATTEKLDVEEIRCGFDEIITKYKFGTVFDTEKEIEVKEDQRPEEINKEQRLAAACFKTARIPMHVDSDVCHCVRIQTILNCTRLKPLHKKRIPSAPYYCCLCDSAYDNELQFKNIRVNISTTSPLKK